MCGRYRFDDGRDSVDVQEIIDEVNRRAPTVPIKVSGEIRPTDVVPVVANNRKLTRAVFPMKWGYTLPNGQLIINARSETAREKPLFRDGMLHRRCAIPATCYYEWVHSGKAKTKYAICPDNARLFYMAGLYRFEAVQPVFAILTREPVDNIAFIHNRMPVILPPESVEDWIDPECPAEEILHRAVLSIQYETAQEA